MSEGLFTSASFNAYLTEGRLMGTRCRKCGSLYLPPRELCSRDTSDNMEWVELSGQGRLAGFSIIYVGTGMMVRQGFDRQHPYCSAVIELEEGPKISAQMIDVDLFHPENIKIGMAVEAVLVERGEEEKRTFLAFRPKSKE